MIIQSCTSIQYLRVFVSSQYHCRSTKISSPAIFELALFEETHAAFIFTYIPGVARSSSRNQLFPSPPLSLLSSSFVQSNRAFSSTIIFLSISSIVQHKPCLTIALLGISIARHQHCSWTTGCGRLTRSKNFKMPNGYRTSPKFKRKKINKYGCKILS